MSQLEHFSFELTGWQAGAALGAIVLVTMAATVGVLCLLEKVLDHARRRR